MDQACDQGVVSSVGNQDRITQQFHAVVYACHRSRQIQRHLLLAFLGQNHSKAAHAWKTTCTHAASTTGPALSMCDIPLSHRRLRLHMSCAILSKTIAVKFAHKCSPALSAGSNTSSQTSLCPKYGDGLCQVRLQHMPSQTAHGIYRLRLPAAYDELDCTCTYAESDCS